MDYNYKYIKYKNKNLNMLRLTNKNIMYGDALQDVENYVINYANQITIEHTAIKTFQIVKDSKNDK
jgi:hypothetical protein